MTGKQQATIEYGVGAVAGGVERFAFGRDVIAASRTAFPDAPDAFPAHLALLARADSEVDDFEAEPNRARAALEDAAKATGTWLGDTASNVGGGISTGAVAMGTGLATAAGTMSRPFRRVDIDGDGIPDEPQALTAAKGVGGAIAGAADAVTDRVSGFFKPKKHC